MRTYFNTCICISFDIARVIAIYSCVMISSEKAVGIQVEVRHEGELRRYWFATATTIAVTTVALLHLCGKTTVERHARAVTGVAVTAVVAVAIAFAFAVVSIGARCCQF